MDLNIVVHGVETPDGVNNLVGIENDLWSEQPKYSLL